MDKYEFKNRIEQLKKRVDEKDYTTALKIVEEIDWNRVRSTNLLSIAADVYEQNGRFDEARDKLTMAFERAPVGRRLLYKLCELSAKVGDLEEAEDYFNEYLKISPDDNNANMLQYLMLKAGHQPYEKQAEYLEEFVENDPDENGMYELAELYEAMGRRQDCIRICDRLVLMFGAGTISKKALRLKQKYSPLTDYQKELLNSDIRQRREKLTGGMSEKKFGTAERMPETQENRGDGRYGSPAGREPSEIDYARYADPEEDAFFRAYLINHRLEQFPTGKLIGESELDPVSEPAAERSAYPSYERKDAAAEPQRKPETPERENPPALNDGFDTAEETEEKNIDTFEHSYRYDFGEDEFYDEETGNEGAELNGEEPAGGIPVQTAGVQEEEPETCGTGSAGSPAGEDSMPEKPRPQARATFSFRPEPEEPALRQGDPVQTSMAASAQVSASEKRGYTEQTELQEQMELTDFTELTEEEIPGKKPDTYHMIIEAETAEEGLEIAIDELKNIHSEHGITNSAVKTTAGKLNQCGLSAGSIEKLRGKDFVIENAGALKPELMETIYNLIRTDDSGMIITLVDTPEGLDRLEEIKPEIFELCDLVSDFEDEYEDEEAFEDAGRKANDGYSEEMTRPVKNEDSRDRQDRQDRPDRSGKGEPERNRENEQTGRKQEKDLEKSGDEEMTVEEFAAYCTKYATEIDCVIPGRSMLALYERIEIMEEDDIPLTASAAVDLIEEAADRAEHPPILKRASGMFRSKYDKNDMLILKEEDFL